MSRRPSDRRSLAAAAAILSLFCLLFPLPLMLLLPPPSAAANAACVATNDPVIAVIPDGNAAVTVESSAVASVRPLAAHNLDKRRRRRKLRPMTARSQDVTRKCLKCYNSSVEQEIVTETV